MSASFYVRLWAGLSPFRHSIVFLEALQLKFGRVFVIVTSEYTYSQFKIIRFLFHFLFSEILSRINEFLFCSFYRREDTALNQRGAMGIIDRRAYVICNIDLMHAPDVSFYPRKSFGAQEIEDVTVRLRVAR